ncbi:MAG: ABC transporter permease, partial [Chloroflexia bacterium]|nr:ABC transporter permease [Chloroflexia bacterium]
MKKIWYLALNDIKIEFSSRWTLLFFLVLPLVFTTVLGGAMSNASGENNPDADPRFPVLTIDQDQSLLSAKMVTALEASNVIRPVLRSGSAAETLAQDPAAALEEEEIPALLVIPAGFGRALREGQPAPLQLHKAPGDNRVLAIEQAVGATAGQVDSAVAAALASLEAAEQIEPFGSEAAREAYFQQGLDMAQEMLADPPARVEATQAPEVTTEIASGFEQSSAGQLVTWTLITLIGAAEVFVGERLGGTLRRLVITPSRKATILSGKIAGRLAMGLVQMALLIGFGALLFNVEWGRSPLALALLVLTFGLAAVAFGVMLGTFAQTRSQASGLTILFSMLMAALGGAWWPLEITPPIYQTVVKVLPTTWAMIGFNNVLVRGQGVAGIWPQAAILLGFALVFLAIGIWRFRYE